MHLGIVHDEPPPIPGNGNTARIGAEGTMGTGTVYILPHAQNIQFLTLYHEENGPHILQNEGLQFPDGEFAKFASRFIFRRFQFVGIVPNSGHNIEGCKWVQVFPIKIKPGEIVPEILGWHQRYREHLRRYLMGEIEKALRSVEVASEISDILEVGVHDLGTLPAIRVLVENELEMVNNELADSALNHPDGA